MPDGPAGRLESDREPLYHCHREPARTFGPRRPKTERTSWKGIESVPACDGPRRTALRAAMHRLGPRARARTVKTTPRADMARRCQACRAWRDQANSNHPGSATIAGSPFDIAPLYGFAVYANQKFAR